MSNERTANGGRLTRAMHRAAAAIYSATVLNGGSDSDDSRERRGELARSEPTVGDSQAPEAQQEGEVRAECHALVPDIPSVQHSQGSGTDATEGALQGQSEGVSDSSGTTQR